MATHRLSMNEVTTFRWSFEEDVWHYAQAGYEAIGIWRQKLADYGEERGVDLVAESKLHVTNLHWAGGFTGNEGHSLQEAIDDAAHAIRIAGALDAGCLVVYPGGRNNHTFRHAKRLLTEAIEKLLPLAEAADVTLAFEPMHPACAAQWTFMTDLTKTVNFLESFHSPHLKIVLDVYHFGQDKNFLEELPNLIPQVALVQLGDRRAEHGSEQNRCRLGQGKLPLSRIIRQLVSAGYNGDFDIELVGQDVQLCDYEYLLQDSKQSFQKMLAPARKD